jgi:hypothetical protein
MTALNWTTQYRGLKGCQGHVFSGPTAASTYQTQYHAPLHVDYTGLPNGRIVYVGPDGSLTPIRPVTGATKFAMPLLLSQGGANIDKVPQTYRPGMDAPYRSASPQPKPNVMALPLSVGYEYMTTEYDDTKTYNYNTALMGVSTATLDAGKIVPLAAATDQCIGFVSQKPGQPRQYGDPASFSPNAPNPMHAVTGINQPGLTFWGYPLPIGAVTN